MPRKTAHNPEAAWFGNEQVEPEEKTRRVEGVFDAVASRYDLMNDLMSGGIHRIWKNRFVRMMRPRAGKRLLDVAGGTGDIALRYRRRAGKGADITVCDLTPGMLAVGRNRAMDRGYINDIRWVEGNAEKLPFDDSSFDLYSIAFGLRNVTHIDDALAAARRVLKPGGMFFCLEFSHVKNDFLRKLYDEYSFRVIPRMGQAAARDRDSYQYLVESIRRFPAPDALAARMEAAGLANARFTLLTGGIAAVHTAVRP